MRGNLRSVGTVARTTRSIPACAGEPSARNHRRFHTRVYPRVCGGTSATMPSIFSFDGLSPRVRGNLFELLSGLLAYRSIPACAGEPRACRTSSSRKAVYPRVCGGTRSARAGLFRRRGLSPRVRGNRYRHKRRLDRLRSIPACAGEPDNPTDFDAIRKVYPRVCGGTCCPPAAPCSRRGIPACAGEPTRPSRPGSALSVYPRVCGGTVVIPKSAVDVKGLSPRVRGNLPADALVEAEDGSIPACAGEPLAAESCVAESGVYPRVCGGTSVVVLRLASIFGLSPRVRGNLGNISAGPDATGSIPACAGEPYPPQISCPRAQVYPRVCGGTLTAGFHTDGIAGLSPRVRGNLDIDLDLATIMRSIPACAGEPAVGFLHPVPTRVYPRVCGGTSLRV